MNPKEPPDATEFLEAAKQPSKPPIEHPRDKVMLEAGEALTQFVAAWAVQYSLTTFEFLYLLSVMLRGQLQASCLGERAYQEALKNGAG